MARRLTAAARVALVVLLAGGVPLAASAADAGLPDPTRPAIDLGTTATGAPAAHPGTPGDAGGPRLQSIIRPRLGTPRALIDGRSVGVGGRVGGARLISIGEDSVVLASSAGRQTLLLTPLVEKRLHRDGKLAGRQGESSQ